MKGRISSFLPTDFSHFFGIRVPHVFVTANLSRVSGFLSWSNLINAGTVLRNESVAYYV
jgi:hypothetical protein